MTWAHVGMAELSALLFIQTRFAVGRRNVMNNMRLGTHTGAAQYAASRRMPSAARQSMCGVRTRSSP